MLIKLADMLRIRCLLEAADTVLPAGFQNRLWKCPYLEVLKRSADISASNRENRAVVASLIESWAS